LLKAQPKKPKTKQKKYSTIQSNHLTILQQIISLAQNSSQKHSSSSALKTLVKASIISKRSLNTIPQTLKSFLSQSSLINQHRGFTPLKSSKKVCSKKKQQNKCAQLLNQNSLLKTQSSKNKTKKNPQITISDQDRVQSLRGKLTTEEIWVLWVVGSKKTV